MFEQLTNKVSNSFKGTLLETGETENVNATERAISAAAGSFVLFKGITNLIGHPFIGLQQAAIGGFLLYRGITGYCPLYAKIGKDTTDLPAIRITETIIVNSPREEVYRFWRNLENMPRFMKHLKTVSEIDQTYSHWKVKVPGEFTTIDWTAQITKEEENRYIGWQSIESSKIDNAGKVEFTDALNGIGTELTVEINYFPPAGVIGHGIAKLMNIFFENVVREDIKSFKHFVEGDEYKSYFRKTSSYWNY